VRKPESGFRHKSGHRAIGTLLGTAHQHRSDFDARFFFFDFLFQGFTVGESLEKNYENAEQGKVKAARALEFLMCT
jgi:hypothetical protein